MLVWAHENKTAWFLCEPYNDIWELLSSLYSQQWGLEALQDGEQAGCTEVSAAIFLNSLKHIFSNVK